MNTQNMAKPTMICNLADKGFSPTRPICASSRDYGFDFDEAELAKELLAPLSASLKLQAAPQVGADEFESCYMWFLS